jgi:hypothetical protein
MSRPRFAQTDGAPAINAAVGASLLPATGNRGALQTAHHSKIARALEILAARLIAQRRHLTSTPAPCFSGSLRTLDPGSISPPAEVPGSASRVIQ